MLIRFTPPHLFSSELSLHLSLCQEELHLLPLRLLLRHLPPLAPLNLLLLRPLRELLLLTTPPLRLLLLLTKCLNKMNILSVNGGLKITHTVQQLASPCQ